MDAIEAARAAYAPGDGSPPTPTVRPAGLQGAIGRVHADIGAKRPRRHPPNRRSSRRRRECCHRSCRSGGFVFPDAGGCRHRHPGGQPVGDPRDVGCVMPVFETPLRPSMRRFQRPLVFAPEGSFSGLNARELPANACSQRGADRSYIRDFPCKQAELQPEADRLTRERSLVRTQPRPSGESLGKGFVGNRMGRVEMDRPHWPAVGPVGRPRRRPTGGERPRSVSRRLG
jgi:hypothetical protein